MKTSLLPPLWIICLIAGLPQLSESVYTPSLPDISDSLNVSHAYVEYTLTIYLAAFAIGTLFWGWISDRLGRKKCIIFGMVVFIFGSIGCYFADSFILLMAFRFVQGFGVSIGSVLGQAVCRDSFRGADLSGVYTTLVSALSVFPAIGPMVGGFIVQYYIWNKIFLFLAIAALLLFVVVVFYLPETHHSENRSKVSLLKVFKTLLLDRRVMGMAFIVAGCNGIFFSYFAEGPFYFIEILGLTPQQFGYSFVGISAATWFGGMYSSYLRKVHVESIVIGRRIGVIIISSLFLACIVFATRHNVSNMRMLLVCSTIISQMGIMLGFSMAASLRCLLR